jgi:hypothetical protein
VRPPETGVRTPLLRDRLRYPQSPRERVRDTSCEAGESQRLPIHSGLVDLLDLAPALRGHTAVDSLKDCAETRAAQPYLRRSATARTDGPGWPAWSRPDLSILPAHDRGAAAPGRTSLPDSPRTHRAAAEAGTRGRGAKGSYRSRSLLRVFSASPGSVPTDLFIMSDL